MNIEIPQHLEQKIVDEAVDQLMQNIGDDVSKSLIEQAEKAVHLHIEETIKRLLHDAVSPLIDEIFESGFDRTNNWGEKQGNLTVREYIRQQLSAKQGGYNRDATVFSTIAEETIRKEITSGMREEMKLAQTHFRGRVDKILESEIQAGLRKALGLKS